MIKEITISNTDYSQFGMEFNQEVLKQHCEGIEEETIKIIQAIRNKHLRDKNPDSFFHVKIKEKKPGIFHGACRGCWTQDDEQPSMLLSNRYCEQEKGVVICNYTEGRSNDRNPKQKRVRGLDVSIYHRNRENLASLIGNSPLSISLLADKKVVIHRYQAEKCPLLGKGGEKSVRQATVINKDGSMSQMAVSKPRRGNELYKRGNFEKEEKIYAKFKNTSNIIGPTECFPRIKKSGEKQERALSFLCQGSFSALSYLLKEKGFSKEEQINVHISVFIEAAKAIQALHDRGCIHRDIKNANLFFHPNDTGYSGYLADLGSIIEEKDSTAGKLCGTTYFLPPECLLKKPEKQTREGDIYAFGVSFCRALAEIEGIETGRTHVNKILENIKNVPSISSDLVELIEAMTNESKEKRPDIATIIGALESMHCPSPSFPDSPNVAAGIDRYENA